MTATRTFDQHYAASSQPATSAVVCKTRSMGALDCDSWWHWSYACIATDVGQPREVSWPVEGLAISFPT